ncbi:MAG: methylated-DNA--[protein]-cysteine S-methyltransferase [Gammaproteobacteria bacterium]|jgi:AraC family transcriptional regulator of adaptative response/methylated-DNA-[protein]-cysteine methyltransferase
MSDYERIAEAIGFISSRVNEQPSLEEIAAHVHLSPFHFQRLFSRWAGITPKRFLQVLTLERAKRLLNEPQSLLEVSGSLGLSSGSRLHDHFVHLEAVTPGEYKTGGAGLSIDYAVHDSPFGNAFIATTPRGVCNLAFLERDEVHEHLADLRKQWPQAEINENRERTLPVMDALFGNGTTPERPLSLFVAGTNFQTRVWKALLNIPPGKVASYNQIANAIGHPNAARAVGNAVGANPIALLIPCHRVLRQNGDLGGYHWGEARKHAILAWEAARHEQ